MAARSPRLGDRNGGLLLLVHATAHGSTIVVKTEYRVGVGPGNRPGLTLLLTTPMLESDAFFQRGRGSAAAGRATRMPKISVVDDGEMHRDMPSRRLSRRGGEVVLAVDDPNGVAMTSSGRLHLTLRDIGLSETAGSEGTRQTEQGTAAPTKAAI